jgi:hypothetical protein
MSAQAELRFDGATYDAALDGERLCGQLLRVWSVMKDHGWHTLDELAAKCDATTQSVSARIRDLRKPRFGGMTVERRRHEGGLWMYRLA